MRRITKLDLLLPLALYILIFCGVFFLVRPSVHDRHTTTSPNSVIDTPIPTAARVLILFLLVAILVWYMVVFFAYHVQRRAERRNHGYRDF